MTLLHAAFAPSSQEDGQFALLGIDADEERIMELATTVLRGRKVPTSVFTFNCEGSEAQAIFWLLNSMSPEHSLPPSSWVESGEVSP